jgi:hypothetical protein
MIHWGPDPQEFAKRNGFRKLSFEKKLTPASFARMVAKIAYSHAVARFGLGALQDEFVTDVILGKSERIGDLIGCVQTKFPKSPSPNGHVLQPVVYTGGLSGTDPILAVRMKLFADSQTPVYEVALGRPADWLRVTPTDHHCD